MVLRQDSRCTWSMMKAKLFSCGKRKLIRLQVKMKLLVLSCSRRLKLVGLIHRKVLEAQKVRDLKAV